MQQNAYNFDNLYQLENHVENLPGAELRTLHTGQRIVKEGSPSDLKEKLGEISLGGTEVMKRVDSSPETNAVGVVNTETEELATTGSTHYDLVTHQQAFEPMIQALRNMGKSVSGKIDLYNDGDVAVLRAFFDEEEFNIDSDSRYREGFQVWNTYNKSSSVVARGYCERLVCSNGMFITGNLGLPEMRRQHRGEVDIVEEYQEWIKQLMEFSDTIQQLILEAREDIIQVREVPLVLRKAGFPDKHAEEIRDLIEHRLSEGEWNDPLTRKQVYDAATNYVSHEVEGEYAHSTVERYSKKAENLLAKDSEFLTRPETEKQQELVEVAE